MEVLVQRARDGDERALNELIGKYRDTAFSIALKFLKDRHDAADVVQEAFISVFRSIGNFRQESHFSTWLYRIVYFESLKALRRRKRESLLFSDEDGVPEAGEEPDTEEAGRSIGTQQLLKVLTPNEYLAVTLFYLEEKSIRDIASIASMSQENVKVLLHRARKKLRSDYERQER